MIEVVVLSCKKSEFEDRFKPGQKVTGYTLMVALPGTNGCVEVWSTHEHLAGDKVNLVVTEGKFHKPKVKVV